MKLLIKKEEKEFWWVNFEDNYFGVVLLAYGCCESVEDGKKQVMNRLEELGMLAEKEK